jgi:hypothetical protein
VLEGWLSANPEEAADYARKLPLGAERQLAVRTISQRLVHGSLERAAKWYRSLPAQDQKTAREQMVKLHLSAEEQQQLTRVIEQR